MRLEMIIKRMRKTLREEIEKLKRDIKKVEKEAERRRRENEALCFDQNHTYENLIHIY